MEAAARPTAGTEAAEPLEGPGAGAGASEAKTVLVEAAATAATTTTTQVIFLMSMTEELDVEISNEKDLPVERLKVQT
ncbi:hypothetical protein ACLOJK_016029 [Asimina triloba]